MVTGGAYEFRLAAQNQEGWSDWSSIVEVVASQKPGAPHIDSVQLDREAGTALVTWQASDSRGAVIQEYIVEVMKADSNNFEEISCTFALEPTQCVIQLSDFAALGLTTGSTAVLRVYAVSNMGDSEMSLEFSKKIGFPPRQPLQLKNVASQTGPTSIGLQWLPPSDNQGYPVEYYRVYWKTLASEWVLENDALTNTNLHIKDLFANGEPILAGMTYIFKVEGRNQAGWGDASLEAKIIAAKAPEAPAGIEVASLAKESVTVQWTASETNGAVISGYKVFVATASEEFKQAIC